MFRLARLATTAGLVALGLLVTGARPAHATITVTFVSVTPNTPVPGTFRWNYSAAVGTGTVADPTGIGNTSVAGGTAVNPGDFFTIYDFAGFTGALGVQPVGLGGPINISPLPGDWTVTAQLLGVTPGPPPPNDHFPDLTGGVIIDNPAVPNLTFRLTGGAVRVAGDQGTFSIDSLIGVVEVFPRDLSSGTHSVAGNLSEANTGNVQRPQAVPEPGTMALFGLGAVGLFFKLRRRKKAD
jgi:hypothetical protein